MQAFYQGAWVQGQYRLVRAGVSCAAVRSGVAKHASRHGRGLAFGLYLNRDAGILSGGVGARPINLRDVLRAYLSGLLPSATQKLRVCYTLLLRTEHPDIYPDVSVNSPVDPEYSERGRGLQNDPITFPEVTQPMAGPLTRGTNVPCVHLALSDTYGLPAQPVRSTRTALAACSAPLARTAQPAELASPAQQPASYFLPTRTLQPSPSALSVHPANPFPFA
jgi:hypothetical protein